MYTVRIFMECTPFTRLKSLLTLNQIINKPDFPSLADEIAEPHPDMNIKVAAFTVNEKSSNTVYKYFGTLSVNGKCYYIERITQNTPSHLAMGKSQKL